MFSRFFLVMVLFLMLAEVILIMYARSPEAAEADYSHAVWKPAHRDNYTPANRGKGDIRWIVIHDIEGTAEAAIAWFQNPAARASAHYVIAYDGTVYQMVREKDIAWHAGNWEYNKRAIGIELAGYADKNMYTEEEYHACAKLVAYLAKKYGIPIVHPEGIAPADPEEGAGIIGHSQVPDPQDPSQGGGRSHHCDPGKYWNWTKFIGLVKHYYSQSSD